MQLIKPKSVAGIMSQFTKVLDQLDALRDAKRREAEEHADKEAYHREACNSAVCEAERAAKKATALAELFR